jgi:hypothetical protein
LSDVIRSSLLLLPASHNRDLERVLSAKTLVNIQAEEETDLAKLDALSIRLRSLEIREKVASTKAAESEKWMQATLPSHIERDCEILGGRSVKAAMWLQGRTDFNSDLFGAKPGRSPWRTSLPARQIAENGLEIGQTPGKRAGPRRVFILLSL